ncbi:MAG: N-sulfoglucosamine sulfohydrolase [Planctomycetota bacterium]
MIGGAHVRAADESHADCFARRVARWIWALPLLVASQLTSLNLPAQALGAPDIPAQDPSAQDRPNILFCIADDWGWPHAGAHGDTVVQTPAFDRVAREGVLFEQCYVSSPSCTPSRNAIFTGQYHWRLREGANLWSSLDYTIPVYPLLLEANGYSIGHWRKSWGPGRLKVGGYTDSHPAGKNYRKGFAQFLKARGTEHPKPFCFWLGASDPHRGYQPGSGKQSGMDLDKIAVPGFWPNVEQIRSDIADYYFEVQRFDRDVGAALQLLEESGELENTIVVVTGDHGMPFPRCKSNCYDMGVRVPLAIRWGKNLQAGRRIQEFVSLIDLAPTFLAAAKVAIPAQMNGRSLWPLLHGEALSEQEATARDHVIFGKERHVPCRPDHSGYPTRGIRTARWAYLRNFEPSRWPVGNPPLFGDTDPARSIGKGTTKGYLLTHRDDEPGRRSYELCFGMRPLEELYDMAKDPDQLHNLAGQPEHQEAVKKLWAQLRSELVATKDPRVIGGGEKFDRYPHYGGSAWRPAPKQTKPGNNK